MFKIKKLVLDFIDEFKFTLCIILIIGMCLFCGYISAKHQKAVFERLTGQKVTVAECFWGAVPKINEINGNLKLKNK